MLLLLQVHSDDENYDHPQLGVVELTRDYALKLLDRIALVGNMADKPLKACWWDYSLDLYHVDHEKIPPEFWGGEPVRWDKPIPFGPSPTEDDYSVAADGTVRTEMNLVEVYDDSVRYSLHEKHVDVRMFTIDIPKTLIEEAAR